MDDAHRGLVRTWLTKAASDLKSARVLSADPAGLLDTAIYHCQQAGEKAVKAFLVFKGISPTKTHDIRKLVIEAAKIEPCFDGLVPAAAALTPYAWMFRYPDDIVETYPTPEEFDEALKHAQAFYEIVLKQLPPGVRPTQR